MSKYHAVMSSGISGMTNNAGYPPNSGATPYNPYQRNPSMPNPGYPQAMPPYPTNPTQSSPYSASPGAAPGISPSSSGYSGASPGFPGNAGFPSSAVASATYRPLETPWKNPSIANFGGNPDSPFPAYFRPTVSVFPCDKATQEKASVPLGLVVTPNLVSNVPVIDYSQSRITRCLHCGSYLSPYHTLQDNSFVCPFCHKRSMLESESRVSFSNIEFQSHVYDMVPPPYYRPPHVGPSFCFVIDLSLHSVSCGLTAQFVASLAAALPALPDSTTVSLVTVANEVVVYDLPNARRLTVCDISDPQICAGLHNLSAPLSASRAALERVLGELQQRAGEVRSNTHCLGSALEVAGAINSTSGAVVIAAVASPTTFGPAAVSRDPNSPEYKKAHSDIPHDFYEPFVVLNKFYSRLPSYLAMYNCSLTLFAVGACEVPTTAWPASLTGGMIHRYKQWDKETMEEFHATLFATLTGDYMWGASTKLRVSAGLKIEGNLGSFMIKRDGSLLYPILPPQNAAGFRISLDNSFDKSPAKEALFQLATLFADKSGSPKIRIFTFSVPCSNDTFLIRNSVDEAAVFAIHAKTLAQKLQHTGVSKAAEELKMALRQLTAKGLSFASLPYLEHALLASPLLSTLPGVDDDDRFAAFAKVKSANITELLLYCYTRLVGLDGVALPLHFSSFNGQNVMLFHTDSRIFVYVAADTPPEICEQLFGSPNPQALESQLPNLENPKNQQLQSLIQECYRISERYLPVEVISSTSPKLPLLQSLLADQVISHGSDLKGFLTEVGAHH